MTSKAAVLLFSREGGACAAAGEARGDGGEEDGGESVDAVELLRFLEANEDLLVAKWENEARIALDCASSELGSRSSFFSLRLRLGRRFDANGFLKCILHVASSLGGLFFVGGLARSSFVCSLLSAMVRIVGDFGFPFGNWRRL